MSKEVVLTYEGLKKLEDELEYLKTIKRKEIAEKIKTARGYGDLSENAEYDAAKEEQGLVEGKIVELEKLLRNAKVIDEDELNEDVISVGATITLHDIEFDEEITYKLVGSTEADPQEGKISNESPVGAALIGHKVGEVVEIEVPQGIVKFKVLDIHR